MEVGMMMWDHVPAPNPPYCDVHMNVEWWAVNSGPSCFACKDCMFWGVVSDVPRNTQLPAPPVNGWGMFDGKRCCKCGEPYARVTRYKTHTRYVCDACPQQYVV